jgi:hypothetical protein
MSSITLIASRTLPSGSKTGVAFTRDQRHSRVPPMRLRTTSGSGSSPAIARRPGSRSIESGPPSSSVISKREAIWPGAADSSSSTES